jgi:hypothetical protein
MTYREPGQKAEQIGKLREARKQKCFKLQVGTITLLLSTAKTSRPTALLLLRLTVDIFCQLQRGGKQGSEERESPKARGSRGQTSSWRRLSLLDPILDPLQRALSLPSPVEVARRALCRVFSGAKKSPALPCGGRQAREKKLTTRGEKTANLPRARGEETRLFLVFSSSIRFDLLSSLSCNAFLL